MKSAQTRPHHRRHHRRCFQRRNLEPGTANKPFQKSSPDEGVFGWAKVTEVVWPAHQRLLAPTSQAEVAAVTLVDEHR